VIIEAKRSKYNKRISTSQNAIKNIEHHKKRNSAKKRARQNNSENDSETFNNYFLRSVGKVAPNFSYNSNIKGNKIQNSIYMMTKIFGNPFLKLD
jgi:hypothetical protein